MTPHNRHPAALPVQRIIATALDGTIVLVGFGLFLAIFYLSGGSMTFTRHTVALLLGAILMLLVLFYFALSYLAGGDTPGMRFAGRKLVDFDGRPPDRELRVLAPSIQSTERGQRQKQGGDRKKSKLGATSLIELGITRDQSSK
jgi:uncharacterized RDD family membrane protein YckC